MRVLVACEMSGIVRDEFRARGHDAWSCDVLCSMRGPGNHLRGDVRDYLGDGWDLMIGFPPCTFSWVGNAWWHDYGRARKREEALQFFVDLYNAPIDRIAIENPLGLPCREFRKPDQTINPFQFGHSCRKRTCLWLKNLPLLTPTNIVDPVPVYSTRSGSNVHWVDSIGPSATRKIKRSMTFSGIAAAMAEQWSNFLEASR